MVNVRQLNVQNWLADVLFVTTYEPTACTPGNTSSYLWTEGVSAHMDYYPVADRYRVERSCTRSFGNPIHPLSGSKTAEIALGALGDQPLSLRYDTLPKVPGRAELLGAGRDLVASPLPATGAPAMGPLWSTNLHRRIVSQRVNGFDMKHVLRASGQWVTFTVTSNGQATAPAGVTDRLVLSPDGWRFFDATARQLDIFDNSGRLLAVHFAMGGSMTFRYSDRNITPPTVAPVNDLLIEVRETRGRRFAFHYDLSPIAGAAPRVRRMIDAAGGTTRFDYDVADNLQSIQWPDGSTRRFAYELPSLPWALTGVVDERGARHSTYGYDAAGRATSTELAGAVARYEASYVVPPRWQITETFDDVNRLVWRDHALKTADGVEVRQPNGSTLTLSGADVMGDSRVTATSQPAGAGCDASTSRREFDVRGNVLWDEDFNGHRTCRTHDSARNLERARIEGLPAGTVCSDVLAASTLPIGARRISTEWHPDWSYRARVAEPGRITTDVYHGHPDPFEGGQPAACAPAAARLPDGRPLAVLCRRVQQATDDATGALGFGGPPQTCVPRREWRWTYDVNGQMLSAIDPQGQATTFAYHAVTTGDYAAGDLARVTNPLGHATVFSRYNAAGQLLRATDANGVVTEYTYDARQRVTRVTVGGQATAYSRWPTGLLERITQPDGTFMRFEYDDAHRNTAVVDSLGHRIDYQLDAAGQRVVETGRDSSGALRRTLERSLDALGRVQRITGREVAP